MASTYVCLCVSHASRIMYKLNEYISYSVKALTQPYKRQNTDLLLWSEIKERVPCIYLIVRP